MDNVILNSYSKIPNLNVSRETCNDLECLISMIQDKNKEIISEVKKFLRPEFINRLDEIVVFNKLGKEDLKKILKIQVENLRKRLSDKELKLDFSAEAEEFVLQSIDSLNYGARPLKRKLQILVENEVANLLISSSSEKNNKIGVGVKKGKLNLYN